MDLNQGQSGERKDEAQDSGQNQAPPNLGNSPKAEEKPKLQLKLPISLGSGEKFYMPKFKMPNLREKLSEYGRVLKVTKKPDMPEFKTIVKASGLGIIIIGTIGFIIAIIAQLVTTL